MNTNQKKALYESIMKSVAKEVKKALNEGIFDEFKANRLQRVIDSYKSMSDESAEHILNKSFKQFYTIWQLLKKPIISDFLSDDSYITNNISCMFNESENDIERILIKNKFNIIDDIDVINELKKLSGVYLQDNVQKVYYRDDIDVIVYFTEYTSFNVPQLRNAGYTTYVCVAKCPIKYINTAYRLAAK